MKRAADCLADYLVQTQRVQEEEKEIYAYGLQIVLELVIVVTTIVISAGIMGMPLECLVLLAVFFTIRSVAGGVHLDSFIACFICSEILIVLALAAIRYLRPEMNVMAGISALALVIIKCFSPIGSNNRPVCDWEREVFRKKMNITIAILIALESILYITDNGIWMWNIAMGELLIVLALTWGKIKYRRAR